MGDGWRMDNLRILPSILTPLDKLEHLFYDMGSKIILPGSILFSPNLKN